MHVGRTLPAPSKVCPVERPTAFKPLAFLRSYGVACNQTGFSVKVLAVRARRHITQQRSAAAFERSAFLVSGERFRCVIDAGAGVLPGGGQDQLKVAEGAHEGTGSDGEHGRFGAILTHPANGRSWPDSARLCFARARVRFDSAHVAR
jgi:hypothetical protein